ncbi:MULTISPECIES: hypothetical protein [Sinorhizobium]|uniref:Pepco domain-containing protein n=1 Tax=Sinorhizobium TaxID=28105 RepID=UPI0018659100|nr:MULTISPECIES: hypothetical protein [Sinorhizobium]
MEREIYVITDAESNRAGARSGEDIGGGYGPQPAGGASRLISLSANGLRDQVSNLLEVVQYAFNQALDRSGISLDELELSIEISSEGRISILGTGGTAGGRGAIKLTFKRSADPPTNVSAQDRIAEGGAAINQSPT